MQQPCSVFPHSSTETDEKHATYKYCNDMTSLQIITDLGLCIRLLGTLIDLQGSEAVYQWQVLVPHAVHRNYLITRHKAVNRDVQCRSAVRQHRSRTTRPSGLLITSFILTSIHCFY